ncbi:hypothetical protein Tco_0835702 [Tanacetum coccineum]
MESDIHKKEGFDVVGGIKGLRGRGTSSVSSKGFKGCLDGEVGSFEDGVFDGAFGGVGDEEVIIGEGVVVTSSSLEMLTNSCLGGIMVNLIFLEGFEEEALVEFMVEFG